MRLFRRARRHTPALMLLPLLSVLLLSCSPEPAGNTNAPATTSSAPTVAEAEKFMADAEKRLNDLGLRAQRASWVQSTFITVDTEALAADTNEDYIEAVTELAGGRAPLRGFADARSARAQVHAPQAGARAARARRPRGARRS